MGEQSVVESRVQTATQKLLNCESISKVEFDSQVQLLTICFFIRPTDCLRGRINDILEHYGLLSAVEVRFIIPPVIDFDPPN